MKGMKTYAGPSERFRIQLKRLMNERSVPAKQILVAVKEPIMYGSSEEMNQMFQEVGLDSEIPRLVRITNTRAEGRDILMACIELLAERAERCE